MPNVTKCALIFLALCLPAHAGMAAPAGAPANWWVSTATDGELQVHFYFFWSGNCPHCLKAKPLVERLNDDYPWLQIHSLEVSQDMSNARRYAEMARAMGEQASAVPAFMVCGSMIVGYDHEQSTGRRLRGLIEDCYRQLSENPGAQLFEPTRPESAVVPEPEESAKIRVPLLGALDLRDLPLPLLTVVLAGLDAFNPCAFFVLLFLLSLLVHARDRKRMFLIGGIFIFFSGLVYFVFMAAWLNVFLLLGEIQLITLIAGGLAVLMGAVNIKDYFWLKQGISLSISDQAKPNLFRRMRRLITADRLPPLILGTVTLAIAANSYEFLCTAGFPMIYTRTLTLSELPAGRYYLYVLLYNLIYIVPLLLIMLLFTLTLGSRKLQEREGRILKLLSGTMMLGLGLMLLLYPTGLNNAGVTVLLLAGALGVTLFVLVMEKVLQGKQERER